MSSRSPPKPWERGSVRSTSSTLATNPHDSSASADPAPVDLALTTGSSHSPPIPSRPSHLNTNIDHTASNYSPNSGASPLGVSPFAGVGGYNNYSSPYSRFGGVNNPVYGGLGGGGYGGMYGGMAARYGGVGQPGTMGMNPNDPNGMTNISANTQATIQILGNLVNALGGFVQVLDSAFVATNSSVFAMASIAEQLTHFRTSLSNVLGIHTLLRYLRTIIAKIRGRPPPADATSLTPAAFAAFLGHSITPSPTEQRPTNSKKNFLLLCIVIFGVPYLLAKLIRSLASSQIQSVQHDGIVLGPDGTPLHDQRTYDPSKLEFCRALYDYQSITDKDLPVQKGDLVVVLSKRDTYNQPSEWWQCRARNGRIGWLPGVFLDVIRRKDELESRTMSSASSTAAESLNVEGRSAKGEVATS